MSIHIYFSLEQMNDSMSWKIVDPVKQVFKFSFSIRFKNSMICLSVISCLLSSIMFFFSHSNTQTLLIYQFLCHIICFNCDVLLSVHMFPLLMKYRALGCPTLRVILYSRNVFIFLFWPIDSVLWRQLVVNSH